MSSGTPRTFYVPDPPQIPPSDPPQHWSKVSSNWTAHLKSDKTGFDVRPIDPNDSTGCRLGPPSNAPDYNVLLEKYGMQVLAASGFLNHTGAKMSEEIYGRLAFADFRNPTHEETLKIHPVLSPNMWGKTTPQVYAMMVPALRLATAVLDDPITLNYFHALSTPSDLMHTRLSTFPDGRTEECKTMEIPDTLSEAEQQVVYDKICKMQSYTNWGFETTDDRRYGITIPVEASKHAAEYFVPASQPGTCKTEIKLNYCFIKVLSWFSADQETRGYDERYRRIFVDTQTKAQISPERRARISLNSAIYRTTFQLASSILHEFAHAFSLAYYETHRSASAPSEPWVKGNRCNEQGHAFENYIFGGLVRPMSVRSPSIDRQFGHLQVISAPFGFYTTHQWDVWKFNDHDVEYDDPEDGQSWEVMDAEGTDPDAPREDDRVFPVPQEWTEWVFSEEAWSIDVDRFGPSAIKVPKIAKWQLCNHDTKTCTDDELENRPQWD
ncbi:hypothetical protein D6C84_10343 [Aureobasidium pullulans]|uniref:Uncharacterized protein n=1 Tax=Aureobasidium pullulans TaxID=5580 RepID=A0A4S9WZV4_AURPU|nr:hypothetical protein D6C84_10343 [Aureobasidium pullulans]